jgi:hypothetical protein
MISFEDPADVRRAYEALRHTFRCEWEDGGILSMDGSPSEGWTIRHNARPDMHYREIEARVSEELRQAESKGVVPTLESRHFSRPSPNELSGYAAVAGWLLMEDPAGGDEGKRLAALSIVRAFNERLTELKLTDLTVLPNDTRRLYNALRACIPSIRIEPDNSGGRMYVLGVTWTPEAQEWRKLPQFRAPWT